MRFRVLIRITALSFATMGGDFPACQGSPPVVLIGENPGNNQHFWYATGNQLRRSDWRQPEVTLQTVDCLDRIWGFDIGKEFIVAGGGTPGESAFLVQARPAASPETESPSFVDAGEIFTDTIFPVTLSPQNDAVLVGALDGNAAVIPLSDNRHKVILQGHTDGITGAEWLSDTELVTASRDGTLRVWELNESAKMRFVLNQHVGEIVAIAKAPRSHDDALPAPSQTIANQTLIASIGEDQTVRFWQPTIGRMIRFFRTRKDRLTALAWAPDGKTVIVGTQGGKVLWIDSRNASLRGELSVSEEPIFALLATQTAQGVLVGTSRGRLQLVEHDFASTD